MIGLGVIFGIVAIALRHGRVTPGKPEKAASPLEPATTACWLMVIVGLIAWLSWTHLVGRFAVTLIAPATVLLGAGWEAIRTTRVRRGGGVVLAILLAVHTCASVRLLYPELAPLLKAGLVGDATLLPTHLPHLVRLNELVDSGERVLMVGDARRFYLARGVDYCVVFSRNPFAEAAAVRSPEGLLEWLRERRYGYVYVDWLEMNRLRSSRYGFWASINFDLFQQLTDVGLRPVEHFSVENGLAPYGTLYALPPARTGPESRADRRAAAP